MVFENWKCWFSHKGKSDPNGLIVQEIVCKRCGAVFYLNAQGYSENYSGYQYTAKDYLEEKAKNDKVIKLLLDNSNSKFYEKKIADKLGISVEKVGKALNEIKNNVEITVARDKINKNACSHDSILDKIPEYAFQDGRTRLVDPVLCPDCNLYLARKKTKIVLEEN